jgi:hypothetical protein
MRRISADSISDPNSVNSDPDPDPCFSIIQMRIDGFLESEPSTDPEQDKDLL